jgi:hypothetical protein
MLDAAAQVHWLLQQQVLALPRTPKLDELEDRMGWGSTKSFGF